MRLPTEAAPLGKSLALLGALAVCLGLPGCSSSDSSAGNGTAGSDPRAGGSTWDSTGGAPAAGLGGAPPTATGGTPPATGGTPDATGGTPDATGGTPDATGGTPPATGGTPPATGGTPDATGGTPPAAGGTPPATGGTPPATGGTPDATGGTPPATGGTPPATGGTPDATGGTPGVCTVGPALSGGDDQCNSGLGRLNDGYSYEVWMDSGSNCATYYGVDGAFKAEWDLGDGGDFLARAGLFFGATEPHDQIGTISADYALRKPDGNGFSWVAVYGWTFNDLAEYYIVEDWSVFSPAGNYENRGTISVDGGTYDVYYNRREGFTSPQGANTDFDQFWSIRREPRQCGHVSISTHFNEWQSMGMDMSGDLREAMIVVEALNGTGSVDFSSLTVQVD